MASFADSTELLNSVWAWDHLLLGSRNIFPVLDPLTTLASIGARTKRVKLGTSVLVLPLRNPVVVSKVLSTVNYLSGGRLVVGTAVGWYEREFKATGTPFSKRGAIFERNFELVKKLLNENDVNYSSEGYELKHASMEPRGEGKIPLLVGGYSEKVLERAGRIGDGWISYYYTPHDFSESLEKVTESAEKNGRSPPSLERVNVVPLAVSDNFESGKKIAEVFTARYMDLPKNTKCSVDSAIKGTVEECIEQIKNYERAGVTELVFIPCDYDIFHVRELVKEILPKLT
jgi:alkanesulfonate monooxygenase